MSEEVTIPEEHNAHYKKVLEATKNSGNSTAQKRIPELYWILRNEEGKSPLDAKDQVKQDLIDTFSRITMDKHFPDEAKDEEKQRAARIRWERKQQKGKGASSEDAETDSDKQTEEESETLPPITVAIGGTQEAEQTEIERIGEIRRAEANREPDEDPKDTEIVFLKDKVTELEDALRQTQQFKPATQLQPEENDLNVVKVTSGIDAIWRLVQQELPKLKNRGWKTVEITMRAV
jgi:hypothetical protein